MTVFKKGELFSGPGGLSLGAKISKIVDGNGIEHSVEHTWANDFNEEACKTFINNISPNKPASVIYKPVQKVDISKLEGIDAFAFGFPCNDFSIVGKSLGIDGEYGHLFTYGIEVLRTHQPRWFIAENVGGLKSVNEGKTFRLIMRELINSGYDIFPHLYKFEEYGVPQARHRIIIVGIKKDENLKFKIPAPTYIDKFKTAREALLNPPILENAPNHQFTRHKQRVIDMLNHIPPGENAWSEKIPEKMRLRVKGARMSQIYRRLHPEKPSYTITGSGGGGTHIYHWEQPRALTNRERARLQSFPDNFVFSGNKEQVRQQIGMAVPPQAAKVIIEAILKTFAGIPYREDSRGPRWSQIQIQKQLNSL
ncbi:DNA cytosine methyltransferase [Halobacillus sp. A5]|uniref:DNA cytosine methyltransferase n=1 Tax=Halobacillus sp. A5 TaxID=2880263 RepID=UPI0020A65573|nr:DNA cytosine methyltransferase [Halobacillus sp. A5]MCP3027013.1 DNA cytosine methyltransferase [Halobacillus sp. A5]